MTKRIHLLVILFLAFLLLASGVFYFLYTVDLIISQTRERGNSDIAVVSRDLNRRLAAKPPLLAEDSEESESFSDPGTDYQEAALEIGDIIRAHVVIVDTQSRLLADSHRKTSDINGRYITADLSFARETGTASSVLKASPARDLSVTVAKKIKETGGNEIIVSVTYRINQVKKFILASIIMFGVFISINGFLVAVLVSYSLKQYKRPISKLVQYTRGAAKGGFNPVSVNTVSPELSQLAENFNSLVERYNLLIDSDNRKYSRINTLLAGLKTGILMVDTGNRITLINPEAERLLNINKLNIFREKDLLLPEDGVTSRILKETERVNLMKGSSSLTLTSSGNRIMDINIQTVFSKYVPYEHSGALVILNDVTEMRRLEKLKDEFVSNVSHEFRTPITVISGFVETLRSWEVLSSGDRDTAVGIIGMETERLKKLISELLFLSKIEGSMSEVSRGEFNPVGIIKEVMEALQPVYGGKKISSTSDLQKNCSSITGVENWFRQIVFNLYDNALKYTPEDGHVSVELKEKDGVAVIRVSDTGPGIPSGEKERIFERFYRADKSGRSRDAGSGLGLAIARQLTEEFNGEISVKNSKTGGAVFQVSIPVSGTGQNFGSN